MAQQDRQRTAAEIAEEMADLKRRLEAMRVERARKEGELNQLMGQLETQFGVKTLDAARAKYTAMKQEQVAAIQTLEKIIREIREQYGL